MFLFLLEIELVCWFVLGIDLTIGPCIPAPEPSQESFGCPGEMVRSWNRDTNDRQCCAYRYRHTLRQGICSSGHIADENPECPGVQKRGMSPEEYCCPDYDQLESETLCPDGQKADFYGYFPERGCYEGHMFTYELVTGWEGCCSVADENYSDDPHCNIGDPAYGIKCGDADSWFAADCPMNTHCVKTSPGQHGLCCPDASIVQPDECPAVICDNTCNGMAFKLDTRGCKTCQCMPHVCPVRNCPVCSEDKYWYSYDSNGCQTCTCIRNPPECPVLDCYCGGDEPAYVVDENLCPICMCRNQLSDERYWGCFPFVLHI